MKKIFLVLISLFTLHSYTYSQGCLPEGITFTTQEQIDNFQFNYPGCTEIIGDIYMQGNSITNLYGLDVLTSTGGSFEINSCINLESLTGLDGLISVGGDLVIKINWILENLGGLNGIITIGGNLFIINNNNLQNLSGLESLSTIGGLFYIVENNSLTNLKELTNLEEIGGDMAIGYNIGLESLVGLEDINHISISNIYISENPNLSACDVQSICNYIADPQGTLSLQGNAFGCNSIIEIENDCLNNCLPGGITFTTQAEIDNFQTNYPGCAEIEGNVTIGDWGSTDITNLDSLIYIVNINGGLSIESNPLLTSLTGLNNLTTIGGYLMIGNWEHPNINLESLEGLGNLTSVEGDVYIESNPLNSLDGLISLNSVGYHLRISMISNIADLHGLENLNSIGGNLEIIANNNLISLEGIENIEAGTIEGIQLTSNPLLTECNLQSICDYLIAPTGSIWIENNATGCNSQLEVEEACLTSTNEIATFENDIRIFPNPANKTISIISSAQTKIQQIKIFNQTGVLRIKKENPDCKIDVSLLQTGLYFAEIKSALGIVREKLIIQ